MTVDDQTPPEPGYTTEEIPIHRVRKSPDYNPRRETPEEELIKHIKDNGQRSAIIVTKNGDWYDAHDGWQRTQAMRELGYETIRAEVYDNELMAARASAAAGLQKKLTKFQKVRHAGQIYQGCRRHGYSHMDAVGETAEIMGKGRETARRLISICDLDADILELMKERGDRDSDAIAGLNRRNPDINLNRQPKRLGIKKAAFLTSAQGEISDDRLRALATCLLKPSRDLSEKIVERVVESGDETSKSVAQIAREVRNASKTPGTVHLNFRMSLDKDIHDVNQEHIDKMGIDARTHTENLWESFGERHGAEQNGAVYCEFLIDGEAADALVQRAEQKRVTGDELAKSLVETALGEESNPSQQNQMSPDSF